MTAIGPDLPSKEIIESVSVIIFAIPTQGLRYVLAHLILSYYYITSAHSSSPRHTLSTHYNPSLNNGIHSKLLEDIRGSLDPNNLPLMIFVNKGIEAETGSLTLEIILDTCGKQIATQATFLVRSIALRIYRLDDSDAGYGGRFSFVFLVWTFIR